MSPVLFTVGGHAVYAYWVGYGISASLGLAVILWQGRDRGWPFRALWAFLAALLILAVLGARALHFLTSGDSIDHFFDLSKGGEVSFAAFPVLAGATIFFSRSAKIPYLEVLDGLSAGTYLALGVFRVGCFLNGCCFGPPLDSPLSVSYPRILSPEGDVMGSPAFQEHLRGGLIEAGATESLKVLPTQLFESALGLAVGCLAFELFRRRRMESRVFGLCLCAYGVFRFLLQFYRPTYDGGRSGGWNSGHTWSFLMMLVGGLIIGLRLRRRDAGGNHAS